MSGFITSLDVELVSKGRWRLLSMLAYKSDLAGLIVVPAGFITDFASVPRLPLAYLLTGDTAHEAAVVHDYLYETGTGTKTQADCVFLEAMASVGEARWRRTLKYWAVRVFGRGKFKGAEWLYGR